DYRRYNVVAYFNDTATAMIYTLSLHDALPIFDFEVVENLAKDAAQKPFQVGTFQITQATDGLFLIGFQQSPNTRFSAQFGIESLDRKSTRLNSVTWPPRMPSPA